MPFARIAWALYNVGVGAAFGALLYEQPVVAIIVAIVVAAGLGIVVDTVTRRAAAARAVRLPAPDQPSA